MDALLQRAFAAFVTRGALEIVTAQGRQLTFGDGSEPRVRLRFTDRAAQLALLWDPELKLGELFMDGRLLLEHGSLFDLLQLVLQDTAGNLYTPAMRAMRGVRAVIKGLTGRNTPARSRHNVAHHYDLGDQLYRLFLDADWQYSCAYFERPGQSLDEAQTAKKRHIAAKLLVEPGMTVLDIGSGWGGLALYLAGIAGAGRVKGITLSTEQLAAARRRAAERDLGSAVSFELEDYRAVQGTFDRIVSVGMFEHVGLAHYQAFFDSVHRLLAPDGVMLLHTIGLTGVPMETNPWITRYIFPGGHLPTLSEIMPALERSGLIVCDVEVLRLHYAETLRGWRERFLEHRAEARALYDERFCRMWEYYLTASEAAFRFEDVVVFQIQLTRRNDVVPLTRGYIAQREAALLQAEQAADRMATAQG